MRLWLTKRRLQFNDGTNKTLEIKKEGCKGTVPTPRAGDDTPLALVMTNLEQYKDKWLNL